MKTSKGHNDPVAERVHASKGKPVRARGSLRAGSRGVRDFSQPPRHAPGIYTFKNPAGLD